MSSGAFGDKLTKSFSASSRYSMSIVAANCNSVSRLFGAGDCESDSVGSVTVCFAAKQLSNKENIKIKLRIS